MSFNCESTGIKCEFIGFNCQFISFKCGFISFNLVNYTRPALLWQRTLWGMLSDNNKDLFLVRKWNLLKCHQYRACLLNTHTGTINLCSKSIPVKTAENNFLGEISMISLIMPIRLQPVQCPMNSFSGLTSDDGTSLTSQLHRFMTNSTK